MARDRPGRVPLWRRLAAAAYDLLIVLALAMVLTIVLILARGGRAIEPGSLWFQLLLVIVWWLYFAWSWTHGGRTVGMRPWRIMVESAGGGRLGWTQASIRFLTAGLSAGALGAGFVASLVDRESRTWHDRLSQTTLRYEDSAQARDGDRRDE